MDSSDSPRVLPLLSSSSSVSLMGETTGLAKGSATNEDCFTESLLELKRLLGVMSLNGLEVIYERMRMIRDLVHRMYHFHYVFCILELICLYQIKAFKSI